MLFAHHRMSPFPVLEFLLLMSAVSLAEDNELGGGTFLPNYLPEELTRYTPAPFLTIKHSSTTEKTNRLLVSSNPSPPVKTMAPTTTTTTKTTVHGTTSTLSAGLTLLTSVKPTFTSPSPQNSTTPALKESPTTTKSTPSTILTTERGPPCNCSTEGSTDPLKCNLTGQCDCIMGYTGLQCDLCEDGYFTNGTSGCQQCGCDSYGALGLLCDSSGVCICKTGVYGDKCDDCRPGYFQFSSTGCQPCQCNNHSNNCDTQSDSAGQPVCDKCKPEYKGPNCEQCCDGFYNADSICVPCNCSGNEEPSTGPRICHPDTGHCLSCWYNTSGVNCERCAEGFTGDALTRNCTPIVLTTPPQSSTMTPSPNGTEQLPTFSTVLISTLSMPTANGTSTTTADVSWAQFNVIVLAVIIVVLVALMGVAGGVYTYREYQNRKLNAPFWTIELKEDNISFSSYHDSIPNADVSGLLEDEMSEVASNGQLTLSSPGNLYNA
ncbi:multiple epidermal growth factor-like domains protein 9 isoform X2 [Hoplias malabaricus]|uniref:multiple epidermal growth factor-like domains protein 9 isoform X2 n=1 Tax=Hoplias malabaricus TaxID=27720 RepID=UPI0034620BD3